MQAPLAPCLPDTAAGATGYKIKRALVSAGPQGTIQSPSGTNHNDTVVTNGMNFYVVLATNAVGESANSAQASAKAASQTPGISAARNAAGRKRTEL
jgi:hypothetical protein